MTLPTNARRVLVALVALVAAVAAVTITTSDDDHDGRPDTITIRLGGKPPAGSTTPTVAVPAPALDAAKRGTADHRGSRDEVPDGVPRADLRAGQEQQDRLAQRDDLPVVTPAAAPQQRGCRSRFVRNTSSRRGVRPRLWVLHYTVSGNRPGWADVDAITGLFNQPSFAASSSYVVDADGHCNYIVRESDKPWTQATYNPVSISVEVIATGREGRYLSPAGYRRLGQVISDSARRWDIPLRRGAVRGCSVVRSGIVDHQQLGSCGGGHGDIAPYSVQPVIDAAKAACGTTGPTGRAALTKTERTNVDTLTRERATARRHGGWTKIHASHVRRANRAKTWLRARLRTIATGTTASRPARRAYIARVVAAA